jgi:hypothetical protein
VNTCLESIRIAKLTRRHAAHRSVAILLCALCSLAMFATSGAAVNSLAQPQTEAKPAATLETTQGQKPEATPTPTTGTIKGRVVSDDGRPVTNATIVAQAVTGAPGVKPARVDAEGNFVFDDLAAAAYIIIPTAPGYIDQSMLSADPSQWPRHLIGAQLKITMIKGGVITGTVMNSKGEPVVGVPVSASLANELSASMSNLMGLQDGAETDDRGIYRIYGLLPGQYIVSAGGGGPFGQFTASGFDLDVPTFYPSATRDNAVPVSVRGGDETTGIDIKYRGAEGHSVSGIVTGAVGEGAAAGAVTIMLSHAGTTSILSLAIASALDQRRVFSFHGVADGDYDLFASFQSGANDNPLVGTKRVTVRGGDVTGIELKLASVASIAGTITLDLIKPEDKCDQRASQLIETVINAPREDPNKTGSQVMTPLLGGFGGTLNAKGEFTVRSLNAGKYRLGITLPTEAWYVRAITPPGAPPPRGPQPAAAPPRPGDTWQGVVTLKAGERVSPVSIVVGQDAAGLRGRVAVTPETAIPAGLRVHLVPEERERADNVLRYSETLVSRDGSFAFTNLAPGRYFVVARVEPGETQATPPRPSAWDPTARIKLRREAEGSNKVVELKPCQRVVDYTLTMKTSQ